VRRLRIDRMSCMHMHVQLTCMFGMHDDSAHGDMLLARTHSKGTS